ncbi:D-galacturonic acid reductase-like protein [Hortaea werneckii]|nr:D-galacturonic acid reductase-like protein [Hortaea werneckii]
MASILVSSLFPATKSVIRKHTRRPLTLSRPATPSPSSRPTQRIILSPSMLSNERSIRITCSSTSSTTSVSTPPTPMHATERSGATWASSTTSTATCPSPNSDISYYLNSHHIDVCESMVPEYRPTKVMASASKGIATDLGCAPETEDTITLLVDWEKKDGSGRQATGVYTASWSAPQKAGVHSQQYFHYMASKGEVRVNQAKRGYDVTEDEAGLVWYNPFYMKYAPDEEGNFAGQGGYGYVSFEKFVDAIQALKEGRATLDDLDKRGLPTLKNTIATGAILEAGRRSLDEGRPVDVVEKDGQWALKYFLSSFFSLTSTFSPPGSGWPESPKGIIQSHLQLSVVCTAVRKHITRCSSATLLHSAFLNLLLSHRLLPVGIKRRTDSNPAGPRGPRSRNEGRIRETQWPLQALTTTSSMSERQATLHCTLPVMLWG